MAEPQEEIIIIEDSEASSLQELESKEVSHKDNNTQKKKLILFGGIGAVTLLLIIILILLLKSSGKPVEISTQNISTKLDENKTEPIEPSKLENMIAKANYLYSTGSKHDALLLYEKIALYSEAISLYNLGVAQLKNKQYQVALKTFQKAISNDEKRCVSAINAAVCALYLEDKESFDYYIDLAYAYLPNELNSPLYSYYFTLINYYNQNYLEALSSLKNPTSNEYPNVQKHLGATINALFNNNYDAIELLEQNFDELDSFSIGLLYARVGDLTLATKYFEDSIVKNIEPVKASLALGLINLKAGKIRTASSQIKNITDMFPQEVYIPYPIKVKLKNSLFNPELAQRRYRNVTLNSKLIKYQEIFYFAPYKVFNANQTISYIRKGNASIYLNNINSAKSYLREGISSSNVNAGITNAIKKALSFNLREANNDLNELLAIKPKHSILQYNLALTYAQMGDIEQAYQHFIRSYHLDAKNYLSGIFAMMCAQILDLDITKLKSILKDSIAQEEISEDTDLYNTLINISENNIVSSLEWLDKDYSKKPFYLALDIIIALELNKIEIAQKSAQQLTILLPDEILPHLMYIDSFYGDLKIKEYASEVLNYLKTQNFHFKDLYFGAYITRYLYIQNNLITGKLYFLRKQLKQKLETTTDNPHEIVSALALASLYDRRFEESYTLYNQLIDDLKVRDAQTLFLGAVASTAAGHHENAIALLELSKMKDTNFLESRYALGLLYLEVKNNPGAVIQLGRVGDNGFNSEFFNFEIDTDKLLFEKQKN